MSTSTYTICEVQNPQSTRPGTTSQFTSLTVAKRTASRNQLFSGSTLQIFTESGALLSQKTPGSKWVDQF